MNISLNWLKEYLKIDLDVKDGMNRYFRGQAFVALCVGILFLSLIHILETKAFISKALSLSAVLTS